MCRTKSGDARLAPEKRGGLAAPFLSFPTISWPDEIALSEGALVYVAGYTFTFNFITLHHVTSH